MKKVKSIVKEQKLNIKFAKAGSGQTLSGSVNPKIQNLVIDQTPSKKSRINDKHIYFNCPHLGFESYTFDKLKEKVSYFLWEQYTLNKLYYSTIIIKTLNDSSQYQPCIQLLKKYLENILSDLSNPKFKAIRIENKKFSEIVTPIEGSLEFLEACGFILYYLPSNYYDLPIEQQINLVNLENENKNCNNSNYEPFYVFSIINTNCKVFLTNAIDLLDKTKPFCFELERDPRLYYFKNNQPKFEPPDNFYEHTKDDIKLHHRHLKAKLEDMLTLKIKSMKISNASNNNQSNLVHRCNFNDSYVFIRIKFPNNFVLQGTFDEKESVDDIVHFIDNNTKFPSTPCDANLNLKCYSLLTTWGQKIYPISSLKGTKNLNKNSTLKNLKLTPTAVLICHIDPTLTTSDSNSCFLKPEILDKLEII